MAGNRVKFSADLDDRISTGLGRIRDKFDQLGGKGSAASLFGNVGAKAVAAGFGLIDTAASAVVGVLGDAKQAFQEDQASQAQLDAALRANIKGYNGQKDAIEQILLARERLGFSDDEQRVSLSSLVTRTHDVNKALELERLAMDLARQRHMDLASASDLVAKAFGGQVGALRKAGIAVDAHATAAEALLAVQKAVAGQAEAYANTDAGKEEAAHQRVQESMEKIGEAVSKVAQFTLPILADAFVGLVDVIGSVAGVIDTVWIQPLKALNDFVGQIPGPWHQAAVEIDQAAIDISNSLVTAGKTPGALAADLRESNKIVGAGAKTGITDPIVGAAEDAHDGAVSTISRTPADIASELRKGRTQWQDAVDLLSSDIKSKMTRAAEIAKIKAELSGKNIAAGLHSSDPIVKAQAEATQKLLRDRLVALQTDSTGYGKDTGSGYAKGLTASIPTVETAAKKVANIAKSFLRVSSPAERGPLSEAGGIGAWGEKAGQLFGAGLASSLPDLTRALGGMPSLGGSGSLVAGEGGGAQARAGRDAGGSPVEIPIYMDGREIARIVDERLYYELRRASPTLTRT